MRPARTVALILLVFLRAGPALSQRDAASIFSLEIPSTDFRLPGNGSAILPPGDPVRLRIHIGLQPARGGYGNISVRINTESAAVIMTTSATATGVNCDLNLTQRQGFRLRPGRNSVEIAVDDARGRLWYASFLLEMSAQSQQLVALAPAEAPTGERYALVLGISEYRSGSGINNLRAADRDAAAVRDFLVSPAGGFQADHVQLLRNQDAKLVDVRTALGTIASRATAEALVFIYLSGHAVSDPDDPRKQYLLAHDSRTGELAGTALPFTEIEDFYGRALKAKTVITFVDVARPNAVDQAAPGPNTLVHQYLMRYASGKGRSVLAAADVGESSWESDATAADPSVFGRLLLRGLRGDADSNRDGTVTFGELKRFVRDEVSRSSGGLQNPTATQNDADAMAISGLGARVKK
jgi:hypothetical protein